MSSKDALADIVFEATDITRAPNASSQPTRDRRKKARQKKAKKGGKAGNQGNFHGERKLFFAEHFQAYSAVKGKGKTLMTNYFRLLFVAYWAKFPWYLPLDKDPCDLHLYPEPAATEEVITEKGKVIDQTEQRIKTHLGYLYTVANLKDQNPWRPLLAALQMRAKSLPPPRRLSDWQLYMTKSADSVNSTFNERWPHANLPAKNKLAFRGAIARELLAAESDDFKVALEDEAVRMHKEEMAEYEASILPGAEHADDDAISRARKDFAAVVQPLLEVLQDYTGLYCTLIAGVALPMGPQEFFLKVVTSGQTSGPVPQPWHLFEEEVFGRDVMRSFTRFLMKTPEWLQRGQATGTQAANPSAGTPNTTATTELSSLGLTLSPIHSPASSPRPPPTKVSKRAKGKQVARQARADESDSAEESDDETSEEETSDEDTSGDETSKEIEGGNEPDDDEPLPFERGPTPTLESLGFGDAMRAKLDKLSAKRRRTMLFLWSRSTDWEREAEDTRTRNAVMMAEIMGGVPELRKKSKKSKKRKASDGEGEQGPPRRSRRLQKEQDGTSTPMSTMSATTTPATTVSATTAPATSTSATTGAPTAYTSTTTVPANTAPVNTAPADTAPAPSMSAATTAPATSTSAAPAAPVTSTSTATFAPATSTSATTAPATSAPATIVPTTTASATTMPMSAAPATTAPATAVSATTASVTTMPTTTTTTTTTPTASMSLAPPNSTPTTIAPPNPASTDPTTDMSVPGTSADVSIPPPSTPATTTSGPTVTDIVPNIAVDMSAWPVWLKESFKRLDSEEYGESFRRAVAWWTVFERSHNWETTPRGLPTEGRPEEVAEWLRCGRKLDKSPAIGAGEAAYGKRWSAWWTSLQPEWRRDGGTNRIRTGEGPWGRLDHPGKNGVFIALLSLMWWKETATSTAEECEQAIEDISWAIWRMSAGGSGSRKHPAEPQQESRKAKKPRRLR